MKKTGEENAAVENDWKREGSRNSWWKDHFPRGVCEGRVQGEKFKYSVMRHKGRTTKENASGREGKEEQVEVAAWHAGATVQDRRSGLLGT